MNEQQIEHEMEERFAVLRSTVNFSAETVRFNDYREINAKFNSTGACGHAVKKFDRIGYHRRAGAMCKICWAKWKGDNADADHDDRFMALQ